MKAVSAVTIIRLCCPPVDEACKHHHSAVILFAGEKGGAKESKQVNRRATLNVNAFSSKVRLQKPSNVCICLLFIAFKSILDFRTFLRLTYFYIYRY